MSKIDKRLWGVLGKQQTYYSPQQFLKGKTKVPLNANPFDSWDVKRSRFNRVDGYENAVQQGGTVIGQQTTPIVSPTPSTTPQPTPTPSFTPTQTLTPTVTPSSTPFPFPTPDLWYDGSDSSSMYTILSGGTGYVSTWTSKGSSTWTLSGANSDRYAILSGSTQFPGNPNIVRFTPNATVGLRDGYTSFGNSIINFTGNTIFAVFALPSGSTYSTISFQNLIYSGNSNGTYTGATQVPAINHVISAGQILNASRFLGGIINNTITPYSGQNINNKFLVKIVNPYSSAFPDYEINNSAFTQTTLWTGTTSTGNMNAVVMGAAIMSGGTLTYANNNIEVAEYMYFAKTLTVSEQDQVELYLKDKWRYSEW